MPHIALHIHPAGIAVMPCAYVTVDGEQFGLCRPPLPGTPGLGDATLVDPPADRSGWELIDPETGEYVARGPTKAETISEAKRRLAGLNPGSLQRAREQALARQLFGAAR